LGRIVKLEANEGADDEAVTDADDVSYDKWDEGVEIFLALGSIADADD
jgi:hypothetical protein